MYVLYRFMYETPRIVCFESGFGVMGDSGGVWGRVGVFTLIGDKVKFMVGVGVGVFTVIGDRVKFRHEIRSGGKYFSGCGKYVLWVWEVFWSRWEVFHGTWSPWEVFHFQISR